MNGYAWSGVLCAALWAGQAGAALPAGAPAPRFEAHAALNGERVEFSLTEALGRGAVVVYFYPAAYTSGCNLQARAFSERHQAFAAAGASIVGVSLDSLGRLQSFSADPDYCAGKFPVVSDSDGKIAASYELRVGAAAAGLKDTRGEEIGHGFAERTTFVVDREGRIEATVSGMGPERNVLEALAAVRRLADTR